MTKTGKTPFTGTGLYESSVLQLSFFLVSELPAKMRVYITTLRVSSFNGKNTGLRPEKQYDEEMVVQR